MLAKSQRLNLKTNFRWVASGKAYTSENFKFFYRIGKNTVPKIGVSIASAQFKKSVDRNKAKRVCFDLVRKCMDQLHKDLNLVIMPRAQVLIISQEKLEQEFNYAVSHIKIN